VRWFYRERLDSGLAPATVHKLHAVLLRSVLCFPLFTNVVEQAFSEVRGHDVRNTPFLLHSWPCSPWSAPKRYSDREASILKGILKGKEKLKEDFTE
jgi:hypothetical protein